MFVCDADIRPKNETVTMYRLSITTNSYTGKEGRFRHISSTPLGWISQQYVFPAKSDHEAIDQSQKQIDKAKKLKKNRGKISYAYLASFPYSPYSSKKGLTKLKLTDVAGWDENGTVTQH